MLIVVSGPDRVGKSTLISQMSSALNDDAFVMHHGAPPIVKTLLTGKSQVSKSPSSIELGRAPTFLSNIDVETLVTSKTS